MNNTEMMNRTLFPAETLTVQPSDASTNDDKLVVYYEYYSICENDKRKKKTITEDEYYGAPILKNRCLEMRREILIAHNEQTKNWERDGIREESMRIYSPYLLKILPDIIGYYPTYALRGYKDPSRGPMPFLNLRKPYRMLSGARDDIAKFRDVVQRRIETAKQTEGMRQTGDTMRLQNVDGPKAGNSALQDDETTVRHIQLLEKELDKQSDEIAMERELHQGTPAFATFDMLWLLFRPGTLVLTKIAEEWACARVYLPVWSGDELNRISYLELKLWYLDFDGTNLRRRQYSVVIHRYDGVQRIDKLPAYPAERFGDSDRLQKLRYRGQRYWELLQEASTQKTYDHYVFKNSLTMLIDPGQSPIKEHYRGQVMVDPVLYAKEGGQHQGQQWLDDSDIRTGSKYEEELQQFVCINPRKKLEKELTETHFQLMPQWITGFAMGIRQWRCFDVSLLEDYAPDSTVIDSLVIDAHSLELMKAVTKRRSKKESGDKPLWYTFRADRIIGKGEGRCVLLHGPPGTGKTYTAECIAEWTGRPLLRLTCGELGLDPTSLERKLWQWFRMAEEWDAALLIDEADVYVSERSPYYGRSSESNTIVAVFLRAIEYYRGLLFLTTNVVRRLDHALLSRNTIVLRFNAFNRNDRRKLVNQTMNKLSEEMDYDFMPAALDTIEQKIINHESDIWNGREIINFFQLAVALAENAEEDSAARYNRVKKPVISIKEPHVASAMRSVIEFSDYQKGQEGVSSRSEIERSRGLS